MFVVQDLIKYLLEGLATSVAAFYISGKKQNLKEIALIGAVAAISFMVLDNFAEGVGVGMRQGAGFGIGYNLVGGGDDSPLHVQAPAPMQVKPMRVLAPLQVQSQSQAQAPMRLLAPLQVQSQASTVTAQHRLKPVQHNQSCFHMPADGKLSFCCDTGDVECRNTQEILIQQFMEQNPKYARH